MTNYSVKGGPAVPAKVMTSGASQGGPAIPVYQILDGDGYQVQGGPGVPMRLITDPNYPRVGGAALPIQYVAPGNNPQAQGGMAIPVYCVNYAELIDAMSIFDWFVDTVNGDDGNTGKSLSQAYKTFAALTSISAGDRIALIRGSYWREEITITVPNVSIKAYGAGPDPVIDCRDIAANASFSKTVGQTNVYEITISPDLGVSTFNSIWEDTTRLIRATSVANCDATPGSYYPTSEVVAPITMYVHATDSSDITANGKVYQYAHRKTSIDSYATTGIKLDHLHTIGNLGESGSIRTGERSVITNCLAEHGNKHNIYFGDGSYLENVTASGFYFGSDPLSPFVFNGDSPAGLGITLKNCVADNDGLYVGGASAFYGHTNVSGTFGTITYDGCTASDCFVVFSGSNYDLAVIKNTSLPSSNCVVFFAQYGDASVTNCTFGNTLANGEGVAIGANGLTLTVNNFTCTCNIGAGSGMVLYSANNNLTVTVTNSTLNTNGNSYTVRFTGTGITFNSNNNTFGGAYQPLCFANDESPTLVSDYNTYGFGGFRLNSSTTYENLAAWQAGTGQDEHSIAA